MISRLRWHNARRKIKRRVLHWGYENNRFRDTGTPCSCNMCRNPRRRTYYSSEEKLTLQERRENDKLRQEIEGS